MLLTYFSVALLDQVVTFCVIVMGLAVTKQEEFWEACGFGNTERVRKLIAEGIDVNWVSYTVRHSLFCILCVCMHVSHLKCCESYTFNKLLQRHVVLHVVIVAWKPYMLIFQKSVIHFFRLCCCFRLFTGH